MDFLTKSMILEAARKQYLTFDNEFREYLAQGNSFNGAYHHFTLEDVEQHKAQSELQTQIESWKTIPGGIKNSSPVRLTAYSISKILEDIDGQLSKSS